MQPSLKVALTPHVQLTQQITKSLLSCVLVTPPPTSGEIYTSLPNDCLAYVHKYLPITSFSIVCVLIKDIT